MSDEGKPAANNLLTALFQGGGDTTVKLVTLALVVVSGGGNFLQTKESGKTNSREVEQAIREIHDLHEQLTASIQRQKEMHDMIEKLSKTQP